MSDGVMPETLSEVFTVVAVGLAVDALMFGTLGLSTIVEHGMHLH